MTNRGRPLNFSLRIAIWRLCREGWSRRKIARELGISKSTVQKYARKGGDSAGQENDFRFASLVQTGLYSLQFGTPTH